MKNYRYMSKSELFAALKEAMDERDDLSALLAIFDPMSDDTRSDCYDGRDLKGFRRKARSADRRISRIGAETKRRFGFDAAALWFVPKAALSDAERRFMEWGK